MDAGGNTGIVECIVDLMATFLDEKETFEREVFNGKLSAGFLNGSYQVEFLFYESSYDLEEGLNNLEPGFFYTQDNNRQAYHMSYSAASIGDARVAAAKMLGLADYVSTHLLEKGLDTVFMAETDDYWELAVIAGLTPKDIADSITDDATPEDQAANDFLAEYMQSVGAYLDSRMKILPSLDKKTQMEIYFNSPVEPRDTFRLLLR